MKELNEQIRTCKRCRLCETRTHSLCGEGKVHTRLMVIAQAPGENEDREGVMFIGPSGQVLDELLKFAQISRDEIFMTNLIKCMLPKYRKPKQDEIDTCSQYLDKEIELVNPSVIATLGYYATRYIFEKYDIALPPKLGYHHIYAKLFFRGVRKIIPLRHPAALLYNKAIKDELVAQYCKLKVLLADCKWYPTCPLKSYYDAGNLDRIWIELYCKGDWENCIRYQMEERGEPHPDSMLPDGSIGSHCK